MDIYDIPSLKSLLTAHEFTFNKNMGQNFLVSEAAAERITALSGADAQTGVLEIGPGAGALTKKLCARAREVLAVELDRRIPEILKKTVPAPNLRLISADVLTLSEGDIALDPPCVAVSNLPYNITAKATLFLLSLRKFSKITLTLQKEAARKVCSNPGEEGWCLFSLLCAYLAERRYEFTISAGSFYPRPGVDSGVVTLAPTASPLDKNAEKIFFALARAAFSSRRKTLSNTLSALFPSKSALSEALSACKIDPLARGECLPAGAFVRLALYLSSFEKKI